MIWHELVLPFYKQGTDFAGCLEACVGDNQRALAMNAAHFCRADEMCKALSLHPRVSELEFSADGHSISVDGPSDLLNELVERELLHRFENDDDDERNEP